MAKDVFDDLDEQTNSNIGGLIPTESQEKKADFIAVIQEIFSDDSIKSKSVLTYPQICAVADALAYARLYNDADVTEYTLDLLRLQISFAGKGRNDLKSVLSTFLSALFKTDQNENEGENRSLKRRLFGL